MTEQCEGMINLPEYVWDKLHELQQELDEGDITQKGYDKKRAALLAPYMNKDNDGGGGVSGVPATGPLATSTQSLSTDQKPRSDLSRSASTGSSKVKQLKQNSGELEGASSPQILPGVRQEAISAALQKRKETEGEEPPLPAPTKRQSFVTRRQAEESTSGNRSVPAFNMPPTTYEDTPPSSLESLNRIFTTTPTGK